MNEKLEKYINEDGMVGVLVSAYAGFGWSTTSNLPSDFLCMDKALVEMKLHNEPSEVVDLYLDGCFPDRAWDIPDGWEGVEIEWIAQGESFTVILMHYVEYILTSKDLTMTS